MTKVARYPGVTTDTIVLEKDRESQKDEMKNPYSRSWHSCQSLQTYRVSAITALHFMHMQMIGAWSERETILSRLPD